MSLCDLSGIRYGPEGAPGFDSKLKVRLWSSTVWGTYGAYESKRRASLKPAPGGAWQKEERWIKSKP